MKTKYITTFVLLAAVMSLSAFATVGGEFKMAKDGIDKSTDSWASIFAKRQSNMEVTNKKAYMMSKEGDIKGIKENMVDSNKDAGVLIVKKIDGSSRVKYESEGWARIVATR